MTVLHRGVCSVARTKRRRFLWCAWWTAEPREAPFRPPDAWSGGARTLEEAQASADRAAGRPLQPIDGHWAAGWMRLRAGLPPFVQRSTTESVVRPDSPYALLGVAAHASPDEIRTAFRRLALVHHPDHGGDPAAFIALKRAYDRALARRRRR